MNVRPVAPPGVSGYCLPGSCLRALNCSRSTSLASEGSRSALSVTACQQLGLEQPLVPPEALCSPLEGMRATPASQVGLKIPKGIHLSAHWACGKCAGVLAADPLLAVKEQEGRRGTEAPGLPPGTDFNILGFVPSLAFQTRSHYFPPFKLEKTRDPSTSDA